MKKLSILICIFLINSFISTCFSEEKFTKSSLDFIYIDSSVDESAGGHAAIRLGQNVFHYQYHNQNGFFLLVKENWPEFKYNYTNLQNRSLFVAKIPVRKELVNKIKMQFLTRYLLQNKRLKQLEELHKEFDFSQDIAASNYKISIKGLGLFSKVNNYDSDAVELRSFVENCLGPLFIEKMQNKTAGEIKEIIKVMCPISISSGKLCLYSSSSVCKNYLNRFIELIESQEALRVLSEATPVAEDSIIYSSASIAVIDDPNLKIIRSYRRKIKNSILSILKSSRPDKGRALIVQIARFQVLSRSLRLKQFITLDPFSEKAEIISINSLMSSHIAIPNNKINIKKRKRTLYEQYCIDYICDAKIAINNFFSAKCNKDIALSQLEASLGRLWEFKNAENNGGEIRIEKGVLIPQKERSISVQYLKNNKKIFKINQISESIISAYEKQLNSIYAYNLLNRNCVTEIFKTVYSCFPTAEQAKKEMGGYFDPKGSVSFIPFCAFYLVKESFKNVETDTYLSYRKRQTEKICDDGSILTKLRESNTLSSSIYLPWEEDSIFLFFTDDIVLARPLLGIGNTLFATVNMIGGVLWSPVDNCNLLKRSVRGVVFSLPELAFFNIRKGTFPATAVEN